MRSTWHAQPDRYRAVVRLHRARVWFAALRPWIWPLLGPLLALLLGVLAYQLAPPFRLPISPYDHNFLSGVHAIETIGGMPARWTMGSATLRMPQPLVNRPTVLTLALLNARPAAQPDPALRLALDQRELLRFSVPRTNSGTARRYLLLLPRSPAAYATLTLDSSTMLLPADPRPLGVVFSGATLAASGSGWRLPPLFDLAALAATALLGYAALRGSGRGARAAALLLVPVPAALAAGIALRPMDTLPFVLRVAALAALACTAIWLARFFAPPRWVDDRLTVRRADLAIYLGLAWWTMPLFQIVLTLDGAEAVTPNPVTLWIGAALGLALLVVLGMRLRQRIATWRWPASARAAAAQSPPVLLFVAITLASLAHTIFLVWFAFQRSGPDFWIHFRAVRAFVRDGAPLYDLAGIAANHFGFSYKWPPFYAVLLRPFVFFNGETVLFGHRIVNTLLLAGTALLLLRQARSWATVACLLLLFNFRPATDTIAFGQVDILLLLGFTAALLAAGRKHDDIAGAIIAVLALIKIYPVLLFGLFLAQRRWRALRGGAIAGLACLALSVAVFGWETHWIHLTQVTPILGSGGGGTAWIENQTFNGFISRFFAEQIVADPFGTLFTRLATYIFFALTILAALLLAFLAQAPPQTPSSAMPVRLWNTPLPLQFSLFVLIMLVAVPAAWIHYHTIAILALAALVLRGGKTVPLGRVAALAAAYALLAYGNQWSFTSGAIVGGMGVLGYSYKFYGLLLLFGLTLSILWTEAQQFAVLSRHIARGKRKLSGAMR